MPDSTANPCPDVELPPGAIEAGRWHTDAGMAHRSILGAERATNHVTVWAIATQYADGSIYEARVHVDAAGDCRLDSAQARQLVAAVMNAVDEIDGWTTA